MAMYHAAERILEQITQIAREVFRKLIDYYNEIFTALASALHTAYEPISVVGDIC